MKICYVAGPYRSASGPNGIHDHIEAARCVAVELWKMGYAALCPHTNSAMMDGAAPDSLFLAGSLEMLRRCDIVVMAYGWWESEGATAERVEAVDLGMPVYYWPSNRRELIQLARGEE